jgi:hypothetical protein
MALPWRTVSQKRRRPQRVRCQPLIAEKKDTLYAFQTRYTHEDGL